MTRKHLSKAEKFKAQLTEAFGWAASGNAWKAEGRDLAARLCFDKAAELFEAAGNYARR